MPQRRREPQHPGPDARQLVRRDRSGVRKWHQHDAARKRDDDALRKQQREQGGSAGRGLGIRNAACHNEAQPQHDQAAEPAALNRRCVEVGGAGDQQALQRDAEQQLDDEQQRKQSRLGIRFARTRAQHESGACTVAQPDAEDTGWQAAWRVSDVVVYGHKNLLHPISCSAKSTKSLATTSNRSSPTSSPRRPAPYSSGRTT